MKNYYLDLDEIFQSDELFHEMNRISVDKCSHTCGIDANDIDSAAFYLAQKLIPFIKKNLYCEGDKD